MRKADHRGAQEAGTGMRFGLIGCGGIGRLRAAALSRSASIRLVAVSDGQPERVAAIASNYGGVIDEDWRGLLRREEVDAVIVSTPPSLHAEMCIEALKSGKHVLCEKPLARTPEECRRILAAAQDAGRFVATGFNYRFYPSFRNARALLDAGLIGELDHIRSYTGYSAAEHTLSYVHDVDGVGGGALRDNGIHLIDLTRYFLGEVVEVKGFASNSVWGFKGCEDNGLALLRNSSGKMASLQASWTEWRGYRFQMEIYGTRGCIRARCFPMYTQVLWSRERGGRIRRKNYFFPITHIMEHLRSYRWVGVPSFIREFEAFPRAAGGDYTALATGEDGLRAARISHEVIQSSRQ